MFAPLRRRDVRVVLGGGLVNDTGDWVLMVALPVHVFVTTGSGAWAASLFVVELLGGLLLGPVGGSLADRWDLKRVLVATNLLQAVALLPLLAVTEDRVWPAVVVAGVQSVLKQVNDPAKVALLPRLVPTDELVAVNTLGATGNSIARLVGAPIGGVLAGASGLGPVVIVDGISFVLVALATLTVRADTSHAIHGEDRVPGGVRAGLREIARDRRLRGLVGVFGVGQVAQGLFLLLFVVFMVDRVGASTGEVGLVRGTMALGGLLGALVVARVAHRVSAPTLMFAGYFGMGAVALAFWHAPAWSTALWLYVVLFAASGIPGAAMSVGLQTTVQLTSPPGAIGRVWGVMSAAGALGEAIGATIAAVGVDRLPLQVLLDSQAAVYLACALAGWWFVSGVADRRQQALDRAGQLEHGVVPPPPPDELGAHGEPLAVPPDGDGHDGAR